MGIYATGFREAQNATQLSLNRQDRAAQDLLNVTASSSDTTGSGSRSERVRFDIKPEEAIRRKILGMGAEASSVGLGSSGLVGLGFGG